MTPAETITILRLYNEWRQGGFDLPQPDPNQITAAIDAAVEMIERLEAAEKERDTLRTAVRHESDCVEAAKAEIKALRAKITEMEKQEPVRWGCTVLQVDGSWKEEIGIEEPPKDYFSIRNAFPLYALPGAQPSSSVPEGWKLVPIVSTAEMDNAGADHCDGYWNTAQAVWDAMLAVAPEAKP